MISESFSLPHLYLHHYWRRGDKYTYMHLIPIQHHSDITATLRTAAWNCIIIVIHMILSFLPPTVHSLVPWRKKTVGALTLSPCTSEINTNTPLFHFTNYSFSFTSMYVLSYCTNNSYQMFLRWIPIEITLLSVRIIYYHRGNPVIIVWVAPPYPTPAPSSFSFCICELLCFPVIEINGYYKVIVNH